MHNCASSASIVPTCTPAAIAQFCGVDVILSLGNKKWQGFESCDDVAARARTGESLQQFLEYQPRGHDNLATLKSPAQDLHLGRGGVPVAPQGERPDTRIDEQRQCRERAAL